MRALREAWISLGIGNRNDSASGLEAGGGMGAGGISDGDRGREWGESWNWGAFRGGVETQHSGNFLEFVKVVPVRTPSNGGYRIWNGHTS